MGPTQEDSGTLRAGAQPAGCLGLSVEPGPLASGGPALSGQCLSFQVSGGHTQLTLGTPGPGSLNRAVAVTTLMSISLKFCHNKRGPLPQSHMFLPLGHLRAPETAW